VGPVYSGYPVTELVGGYGTWAGMSGAIWKDPCKAGKRFAVCRTRERG